MENAQSSNINVHETLSNLDFNQMANRIKEFRILNGLSQKDIASILKTSVAHISNVESGKTKLNLFTLIAYSYICDFSIDSLVASVCPSNQNHATDILDYKIYIKAKKLTTEQKIKLIQIIDIL